MAASEGIDQSRWLDDQLAAASRDLLRSMMKTLAEADQFFGVDYVQRSPYSSQLVQRLPDP